MTTTETAPTASDLKRKADSVRRELAGVNDKSEALLADLSAAMLAGDETAAHEVRRKMSALDRKANQLVLDRDALDLAIQTAEADEEAAERRALADEYNAALDRADAVLQKWVAHTAQLAPMAPELRAAFDDLAALDWQLFPSRPDRPDRRKRPTQPWGFLQDVLSASLPGAHGASFSRSRGDEALARLRTYCGSFKADPDA